MATRRRRNGLALRKNTSIASFTVRMEGTPGKAHIARFKKLSKAEQERRFRAVGGKKALKAWRAGRPKRQAENKEWWEKGNRPSWHPEYKGGGSRRSGAKKATKGKDGRMYYYIGGKRVSAAAYKAAKNPSRKRRNPARRRNSYGGISLRANPMSTGIMPVDAVAGAVDKVPVVGKPLAPYVAPLAVGAASGAGVFYLTNLIEDKLPEQVQNFSYALSGALGGAATLMVPVGSTQARRIVAAAMVTGGAAIDMFRYLMAREATAAVASADVMDEVVTADVMPGEVGGYGALDYTGGALNGYGAWEYSGAHEYGDSEEGAEEYNDAEMADADTSGDDFDEDEGRVLIRGPRHWFSFFGRPGKRMYHRTKGTYSRHAGRRGHRWGWLIKMVGFKGARYIAGLQPHQRRRLILQLKAQAKATVKSYAAASSSYSGLSTLDYSGAAGGSYGATAYVGGPL